MGRAAPSRTMTCRLATDRSLAPTLSDRARERTCCANVRVTPLTSRLLLIVGIICTSVLAGCGGVLLPQIEKTTDSSWKEFEDIHQAFDRIIPGETRTDDLNTMGFDPFQDPNIRIIDYLQITERFLPNQSIRLTDLHPAVRECLQAKAACRGYEVKPQVLHKDRYGNVLLDVFRFRRKTQTTGWSFDGLIVLNGDLVVYKLDSGAPKIRELEDEKNPLGPLQDISVNPGLDLQ